MKATGLRMFAAIGEIEDAAYKRFTPWLKFGRGNRRSQKTVRREIRRRSNLPKATQKRLGFKCH